MHMHHEESATAELRFNTHVSRTTPRLEQKWVVREGAEKWHEWRDVPYVDTYPGVKVPISTSTCD